VPLLVEARVDDPWDLIVVADAPVEMREKRLMELRGMSVEEAHSRLSSQVSDAARRAIADVVIDTSGTLESTHAQVDALWERLRAR
jgi:dephospho-CoA kinase